MISFLLLLLGLFLIFLEFFLPGAIMGSIGALIIISSIVLFASESDSLIASFIFFAIAIASTAILIKCMLWYIPRAKRSYSIYSSQDQKGYQASTFDASTIGKVGIVISDLKPGGYIKIENKRYQALSLSGYISQGAEVIVVSGQEESLLVKPVESVK